MPKRNEYIAGEFIGKCCFLREVESVYYGKALIRMAEFRCSCGKKFVTGINQLRSGNTNSCGCYRKEVTGKLNYKHGEGARGSESPEFISWQAMITRCYNKNQDQYMDYGGRGIGVCDRWRHSFQSFLEDVGRKPTHDHSLDRWPNKDGNYEPGNVRWATTEEQQNNKRSNNYFIINGEQMTIPQIARLWGVKSAMLYDRVKRRRKKKCYPCTYFQYSSRNL